MILQYRDREHELVAASHICQYWRSALISDPSLWTSIYLGSYSEDNRALMYLERSNPVTIDVRITRNHPPSQQMLQHLATNIPRTRSLVIDAFNAEFISSLLLCNPVPSLEHLEMHTHQCPVNTLGNLLGQQAPSLRSVVFNGSCPLLRSSQKFPLPSLTKLDLRLPKGLDLLRISLLLRLCSSCPRLQNISIRTSCSILSDNALGKVISLNSLVELTYLCEAPGKFIPFLNLPRLEKLSVISPWKTGTVDSLGDLLPHSGHLFLSGTTSVSYLHKKNIQIIKLSGERINASFTIKWDNLTRLPHSFLWGAWIPFGQIEDLEFWGEFVPSYYPIYLFKCARTLRTSPHCGPLIFQSLHRQPGAGIPCPSLRRIETNFLSLEGPTMRSLTNLVKEREHAGHHVELVGLQVSEKIDLELAEELGGM